MGTLRRRMDAIAGPAAGKAIMGRVQLRTIAAMKRRIPRKTSSTSRALHPGPVTPDSARILGTINAIWLDQGTRPHTIRPKSKKALAWAATQAGRRLSGRARVSTRRGEHGGLRFAKVVHHPGTKAQPYISESVREAFAKSSIADVTVELWNRAG